MVRWVRKGGEVEGDMREGEGVSGGGKGFRGTVGEKEGKIGMRRNGRYM